MPGRAITRRIMKHGSYVVLPLVVSLTLLSACTTAFQLDMELEIEGLPSGSEVLPCAGVFGPEGQVGPVMCDGDADVSRLPGGAYSTVWQVSSGDVERMFP